MGKEASDTEQKFGNTSEWSETQWTYFDSWQLLINPPPNE